MTDKFRRFFLIPIVLSLLVGAPLALNSQTAPTGSHDAAAAALDTTFTYLPVIRTPPLQTIFGIDMGPVAERNGYNLFATNGTSWIRRGNLLWSEVEPTEGARNWAALAGMEQEMINAAQAEIDLIMIVTSTPAWARQLPDYSCGPVRQDKLAAFANFLHDLVDRYSRPPFNLMYYEIWNEPDAYPNPIAEQALFGCWGDPADPYYGGRYYGEMLQEVGPPIRAANPNAKIVFGGLLLDCDPAVVSDCPQSRFLEGALRSGAGPHFDAVSFHAYDYFYAPNGGIGVYANLNWNSFYNTTGPATHAKTQFVKNTLSAFGETNKLLINSETALICFPDGHPNCTLGPTSDFALSKAYYVAMSYAAAIAEGLDANIWYNVFGWRDSGLLYGNLDPRPAYDAYVFARAEMQNASFISKITSYSNIMGYELDRGDKVIWIIWSTDGDNHTINLPETPETIYDVFGFEDPSPSASLTVSPEPVYLEWPN
jgi:hypothetical protein